MPKSTCKGIKKDGTPCRANGLSQLDGYCLAHGPPEKTREWRSLGGKNSSTAARSDKRLPERYQNVIETLTQGIFDVRDGKLDPAVYTAMCRGAKVLAEYYRMADAEMDLVRSEEFESAAAEVAGVQGDLAILNAASRISAEYERYRVESLVDQGLATLDPGKIGDSDEPGGPVLTDAGRRRLGLQRLTSYTQQDIDRMEKLLNRPEIDRHLWTTALNTLIKMRAAIEEAMQDLARDPEPARDPLTGHTLSELPAGVKAGPVPAPSSGKSESAAKILERQRDKVERLILIYEERFKDELDRDYVERIAVGNI